MRAQRPPDAIDPREVAAAVAARAEYDAHVAALTQEVQQLTRIVDSRRAGSQRAKQAWQRDLERVQQLRQIGIPALRHDVQQVRQELAIRQRDLAHLVHLAATRVQATEGALASAEAELQALVGEELCQLANVGISQARVTEELRKMGVAVK